MDWTILLNELTKGSLALIQQPGRLLMMVVGGVLIYLAIAKDYEPSLLLPIGIGCILANLFGTGMGILAIKGIPWTSPPDADGHGLGIFNVLYNAGIANDGQPVTLGIRPEHLVISEEGAEGEVIVVEPTGSETQVVVRLSGRDVIGVFRERHDFRPGEKIHFHAQPDLVHLFDKGTGQHL